MTSTIQEIKKMGQRRWSDHVSPATVARLVEDRSQIIRDIGLFDSSKLAEETMATLPYCSDRSLHIAVCQFKYSTSKLTAIFIQTVKGKKCFQIYLSAKTKSSRTITFTDATCNEIAEVGKWVNGTSYTDLPIGVDTLTNT